MPKPEGLCAEEWWLGVKINRDYLLKPIPLLDKEGRPFCFLVTDFMAEQLHYTDLGAGGRIGIPQAVTNPETKNQYYVSSLMEEAITSSQLHLPHPAKSANPVCPVVSLYGNGRQ